MLTVLSSRPLAGDPEHAIEAGSGAAMSVYGKTFRWASTFLGDRASRRVRRLYAFCRYVDELADSVGGTRGRLQLDRVAADLDRESSGQAAVRGLLELAWETGLDLDPARELVRGVTQDLEATRFESLEELRRYAFRVAGTVGLMLCDVFEVSEQRARPFAIDLGIGMQFTNIARDVLEDARAGRVYLPRELLQRSVFPEEIVDDRKGARASARRAVEQLLDAATPYYRSADLGMRFLPRRPRLAALTASRCYEAIGSKIRRRGVRYWDERVFVGTAGKIVRTIDAFGSFGAVRWSTVRRPVHDRGLHEGLEGLPGVAM